MDPLVAVTNTTPIIALAGIHQLRLRLLDLLSDRVVVRIDVWIEVSALPDRTKRHARLPDSDIAFQTHPRKGRPSGE